MSAGGLHRKNVWSLSSGEVIVTDSFFWFLSFFLSFYDAIGGDGDNLGGRQLRKLEGHGRCGRHK